MNNRNLEYDEACRPPHADMVADALMTLDMASARGSIARFMKALMDEAPNGERVTVQYFPNGDWFVGKKEEARKQAARERWARSIEPNRRGKYSASTLQMIADILDGKYDDAPVFRLKLAEEFLAEGKAE